MDDAAFGELVAPHRRELRAYCYRMAGSLADADDLLQETMLRAWRGISSFEGRASLRTWLFRVAWSACIDHLEKRATTRSLPVDRVAAADPSAPIPPPDGKDDLGPCPASLYADDSPEGRYTRRESVGLAFLAALQLLPPKQRATLLACDVLAFSAEECAELLGSTVASVNSALQRARSTLEERSGRWHAKLPDEATTQKLLSEYVRAWEEADVPRLVSLLRDDATLTMPPLPIWLSGAKDIGASIGGMVLVPEAKGAFRFVVTEANGVPALAAYRRGESGAFEPNGLHVLALDGDRIASITAFLDPRVLGAFDLPTDRGR
jgi:RNA polymerase sigma-70 factor (ECF subfamily)